MCNCFSDWLFKGCSGMLCEFSTFEKTCRRVWLLFGSLESCSCDCFTVKFYCCDWAGEKARNVLVGLFNACFDCLFEYSLFPNRNTITQSPPKNLSIVITQTSNTLSPAPLAPPCIHAGDLPRTPNPSRQQRKTALQPRTSFPRDPFPTSRQDQHHKHGPFTVPHPRLPRPHPHLHLLVSNLHPPRPFQTHLP